MADAKHRNTMQGSLGPHRGFLGRGPATRGVLGATERANQDDWSRLRNALESAVRFLVRDVQELVTILGLIEQTPALCARLREKQAEWRPEIVARLQKTTSSTDGPSVIANVRVAAALEILWIVLGQWSASDGQEDLGKLLDAAFAAFSTPACQQTDAPL
ncbi:acyl-CoA-like ligand-binding transcription factor [Streptomyces sp. NPDC004393]